MTQDKEKSLKKMREIAIFRNMIMISNEEGKVTMLHEDDMSTYNSWYLTEYHSVDKVLFRGESSSLGEDMKSYLDKIGNPKKVIITVSTKDTY